MDSSSSLPSSEKTPSLEEKKASKIKKSQTSPATSESPKTLKKAIRSLEICLATDMLSDQERSNIAEVINQLKQALKDLPTK